MDKKDKTMGPYTRSLMPKENNNWINVKDKIPEDGKKVLMYVSKKVFKTDPPEYEIYTGDYRKAEPWTISSNFAFDMGEVLYWMELPEEPNE